MMDGLQNGSEFEKAIEPIWIDANKHYHEQMEAEFKRLKGEIFDALKSSNNVSPGPENMLESLNALHTRTEEIVLAFCGTRHTIGDETKSKIASALKFQLQKYTDELKLVANSMIRPVIGIDLGTTNCCVAVYHKGRVDMVPNGIGVNTTPSYVAISDDYEVVGQPAKDEASINPENTIFDAKRLIGRKFDERVVQDDMKLWPYKVVPDENQLPKVKVEEKTFYPEEISAKILAVLKADAENFIEGIPITDAVITVPAYFNNGQRQATKEAGKLAGLNVLQILNEPTAAAITFSLHRIEQNKRNVLIFDLGGGTFDVSVLTVQEGVIKILAVGGDTHLGGEDFDNAMVDYCIQEFKKKTGVDLSEGKDSPDRKIRFKANKNLRRLRDTCEKQKRQISFAPRAVVALDSIHGEDDLRVVFTRKILEDLIQDKLTQCINTVDKVLSEIPSLTKEDINDVVLVGGSTRIPKVQEMLSEYFGGKVLSKAIHPDEAVAQGAAILACLLGNGKNHLENPIEISDVTPLPLGVLVLEGAFSVIVAKNTPVPCQISRNYRTREDNQTSIWIPIYEGEDQMAKNNHFLGEISLNNIPEAPAGSQKYDVLMKINSEGILSVEATSHGNPLSQEVIQINLTSGRPKHY